MAANSKELVILQGYAKTGVTLKTQQKIVTQGYASSSEPPPGGLGGIDIVFSSRFMSHGASARSQTIGRR